MLRVIGVLVVLALIVYTAVIVVQSDSERVRYLPKVVWLLVVIFLPVLGAACWWIFGRPSSHRPPAPPRAPDDDPDFLRSI